VFVQRARPQMRLRRLPSHPYYRDRLSHRPDERGPDLMAAIDDSWDVHDYCVKMGLDPDRVSHLNRARDAMYAEARARSEASMTAQERDDRDARIARNVEVGSRINALIKSRWGRFGDSADVAAEPLAFQPANDQGRDYNFPIRLQMECDHSAKCSTCEWVSAFYAQSQGPAFALEAPEGGWPDNGIRYCGACMRYWRATDKCSHENQQT